MGIGEREPYLATKCGQKHRIPLAANERTVAVAQAQPQHVLICDTAEVLQVSQQHFAFEYAAGGLAPQPRSVHWPHNPDMGMRRSRMASRGRVFSCYCAAICCLALAAAYGSTSPGEGNNRFGFALIQELEKQKPGENIFVSPYSISTALQMVRAGAAGETKAEMDRVLNIEGDAPTAAKAYKEMESSLREGASNAVLNIANAIWYAPNIELKPEFVSLNRDYYGAKLSPLDFTDPRAAGMVNKWVEEATKGKITRLIEGRMSGMTGTFLCNAIYFKGKWETPFDPKQTEDRLFHLAYGQQKTVPMMRQHRRFSYQETDTFQAVRLDYAGSQLGMYVFLPKTNSNPQKLRGQLKSKPWGNEAVAKFARREGTLQVPRFKMEYAVELKDPLMAMGMRRAFSRGAADFSGMSSTGLFVDAVKHKSFVEVNEEGTEAAAVTGITMKATGVAPMREPFEMIVDRPFVFIIEDAVSHTILFLGEVQQP